MELVGATRKFIRRPYIIQGILQGGFGGLIASVIIILLFKINYTRFSQTLAKLGRLLLKLRKKVI